MTINKDFLKRINEYVWEIPIDFRKDMRVPGRIFASERILNNILKDQSLEQVVNVATLPGIQGYSLAMPDIHEGYGFAVGGVAAMDQDSGVISPGGIGFDINCGIRVLRSKVSYNDIRQEVPKLTTNLYQDVPSGVGKGGRIKLTNHELERILKKGVSRVMEMGYADEEDLINCESGGCLNEADPKLVSDRAKNRGKDQLGTLGSGNHFIEVQRVDKIFDGIVADKMGLFENQVVIMIHCGSRGLGHQVATDYIRLMLNSSHKHNISLPDRQLACSPVSSEEGQRYLAAMSAAANFAWANRQLISWQTRKAWKKTFGTSQGGLDLIYDVAHNIAKMEEYGNRKVVVHRKGATRSFPDQPVLVPGSMGTSSFILLGSENSLKESFGSSCHGAGRVMSRSKAKRSIKGSSLRDELEGKGISVRAGSMSGLAEEAPSAYKDVEDVVDVVHKAGLAKKVVRLKPVGVVKG